jgi:hypothetical protein
MGLSFTIAACPRQRSHSQVRVPWDSWPHFTVSDSRLPNLEGQIPYLYSSGSGWPGYTLKHWVLFKSPLRLAGVRWRYSTPPPHGICADSYVMHQYNNCWEKRFLCGPCRCYITSWLCVVSSAVGSQLVQLGSFNWKVPASEDRSRWIWKPGCYSVEAATKQRSKDRDWEH